MTNTYKRKKRFLFFRNRLFIRQVLRDEVRRRLPSGRICSFPTAHTRTTRKTTRSSCETTRRTTAWFWSTTSLWSDRFRSYIATTKNNGLFPFIGVNWRSITFSRVPRGSRTVFPTCTFWWLEFPRWFRSSGAPSRRSCWPSSVGIRKFSFPSNLQRRQCNIIVSCTRRFRH